MTTKLPALAVLAALASLPLAGGIARADEPWEAAIQAGIEQQESDVVRLGIQRLVTNAEAKDLRDPGLVSRYLLARAYGRAGKDADAIATYGEAIGLDARCHLAWRDRGLLFLRAAAKGQPGQTDFVQAAKSRPKEMASAEQDLQRAVDLKPRYLEALRPLAQVKMGLEKLDEASVVLNRILDVAPGDETARFQLADVHLRSKRLPDALRQVEMLLSRKPTDPGVQHMKARILAAQGDTAGAMAIFRRLAEDNPAARPPLNEYLMLAEKAKDRPGLVWALEALRRIARSADERQKLSAMIDRLRQDDPPETAAPKGPPTAEQLAALIAGEDLEARAAALSYVLRRSVASVKAKTPVQLEPPVVKAVLRVLGDDEKKPSAHRMLALRILGMYGPDLAAVVRLSLKDRDPTVRLVAVDSLVDLANPASVVALAPYARLEGKEDRALATAARAALYAVAGVPPPDAEETPEAQAAAFHAWWTSPLSRDAKLRSIEKAFATHDLFIDDLLHPMLADSDDAVRVKAYLALKAVSEGFRAPGPRGDWLRSLPVLDERVLKPEGRDEFAAAVESWWKRRPAS